MHRPYTRPTWRHVASCRFGFWVSTKRALWKRRIRYDSVAKTGGRDLSHLTGGRVAELPPDEVEPTDILLYKNNYYFLPSAPTLCAGGNIPPHSIRIAISRCNHTGSHRARPDTPQHFGNKAKPVIRSTSDPPKNWVWYQWSTSSDALA